MSESDNDLGLEFSTPCVCGDAPKPKQEPYPYKPLVHNGQAGQFPVSDEKLDLTPTAKE